LWARLRVLGVRESLLIEREVLRRILKSTLAATIAWEVAVRMGGHSPALACLGAILVVQITVRASLARSIQLTIGVTLGLLTAIALGDWLGLQWWSIAIVVLGSLIAGELLRLGPFSTQVALSALLALTLGSKYGTERAIDTAIGALIGVAINALIVPASHVSEASRTLRGLGEDLGALLNEISAGLAKGPDESTIRRWLKRARDLGCDSRAAIETVKQGEESLQFNPWARDELAQLSRLTEARRALDHSIAQTRGIIRSLLDLPQPIQDPQVAEILSALGSMIRQTAVAVAAFGRLQERPSSAEDRLQIEASRQVANDLAISVVHLLRQLTAPYDEIVVAGTPTAEQDGRNATGRLLASILVDVERLVQETDIRNGAHRAAVVDPEAVQ
jgi:uncharacterized membrane protein YccC